MRMPINAADSIALVIFIVGFIFLYIGINSEHTGYILLGCVEFILGFIQLILNRKPVLFE